MKVLVHKYEKITLDRNFTFQLYRNERRADF